MADPARRAVRIPADGVILDGDLTVPSPASGVPASGVVVFAHGSGSSRHSPRNRRVAEVLHAHGLATLLLDLLTPEEEAVDARSGHLRFDTDLLARRVEAAVVWVGEDPAVAHLPVGAFGASTGAAGALLAAAHRPDRVRAVVSRGGRPDLAEPHLPEVRAPTLLIVGGRDRAVLAWNREALARLGGPGRLEVVPGATHLFEEPGALDEVARLAAEWFAAHLGPGTRDPVAQQSDKHGPIVDDAMQDPRGEPPEGYRHRARPDEGDLVETDIAHARPDEARDAAAHVTRDELDDPQERGR